MARCLIISGCFQLFLFYVFSGGAFAADTFSISGIVRSPGGVALPNIKICSSGTPTYKCVVSDGSGRYNLSGLESGLYSLSVTPYGPTTVAVPAGGFSISGIVSGISLVADAVKDVTIPLTVLTGKTTDQSGAIAVSNVSITFPDKSWSSGGVYYTVNTQTVTSDSTGNFMVVALPYDLYSANLSPASNSGYLYTTISPISIAADTYKDLKLKPAYVVSGKLKNQYGIGISNFKLCAYPLTTFSNGKCGISADDGSYSIGGVDQGVYRIVLTKYGSSNIPTPDGLSIMPIISSLQVTGDTHQDITAPIVTFTGHIYNRNNQPIVGATASIPSTSWTSGSVYTFIGDQVAKTDSDGRFTIALIPYNSYSFSVSPPVNTNYTTWAINPFAIEADVHQEKLVVKTVPEYKLSVSVGGGGGGTIISNPTGLSCLAGNSGSCFWYFEQGTQVSLVPVPDSISFLSSWGGACNGTAGCLVEMNADKTVSATIDLSYVAKIGGVGYVSVQEAYSAALDGDRIALLQTTLVGDLVLGRPISVFMSGGFGADFTTLTGLPTIIDGALTISQGGIIVDGLVIK